MKRKYSLRQIRDSLKTEISGALGTYEKNTRVEISGFEYSDGVYSTIGTFEVVPFFVERTGSFKAKMNDDLSVLSLDIDENED